MATLATLTALRRRQGMPDQIRSLRREHLEARLVDRRTQVKPTTASIELRRRRIG